MWEIGEIIDNRYELLAQIGRGGMSVVYVGFDKRLNRSVAVKEVCKTKGNEVFIDNIFYEAELLKKIDFKGFPRIYDIIDTKESVSIVMEYIEGKTLREVLNQGEALSEEKVIEWGKILCEMLLYLHSCNPPIIYRDMKPSNIIITPTEQLYLIDFGIAKEYIEDDTSDTTCLGTRGYAAPEQFGENGKIDQRTDIYCLGVTLHYLLTGKDPAKPPYELLPIRQWDSTRSKELERIIIKCTQLNPDDRYQTCTELMIALECIYEQEYKGWFRRFFDSLRIVKRTKQISHPVKNIAEDNISISMDEAEYFANVISENYKEESIFLLKG